MTPREISELVGLHLTTCYHLVNTLEAEGYLRRDPSRRVSLGHRVGRLHDTFASTLNPDPELLEFLHELNRRTRETSYLGVWDDDEVVSVALREGRGGVAVRGLHIGYRSHAYARALGRALLAFRDDEFIQRYLDTTNLVALTPHTVTNKRELLRVLEDVRDRGVAIEHEEFTVGVCCAGAPVFDWDGNAVASLSVSVPKARFDVEGQAIEDVLVDIAGTASQVLANRRSG